MTSKTMPVGGKLDKSTVQVLNVISILLLVVAILGIFMPLITITAGLILEMIGIDQSQSFSTVDMWSYVLQHMGEFSNFSSSSSSSSDLSGLFNSILQQIANSIIPYMIAYVVGLAGYLVMSLISIVMYLMGRRAIWPSIVQCVFAIVHTAGICLTVGTISGWIEKIYGVASGLLSYATNTNSGMSAGVSVGLGVWVILIASLASLALRIWMNQGVSFENVGEGHDGIPGKDTTGGTGTAGGVGSVGGTGTSGFPPPEGGYCSGCGKPLNAGAVFCGNCGREVAPRVGTESTTSGSGETESIPPTEIDIPGEGGETTTGGSLDDWLRDPDAEAGGDTHSGGDAGKGGDSFFKPADTHAGRIGAPPDSGTKGDSALGHKDDSAGLGGGLKVRMGKSGTSAGAGSSSADAPSPHFHVPD